MKKEIVMGAFMLLLMAAGCKQSDTRSDRITVDVIADYPKKELILQDFMEVEYIPLETNDEFVTQGNVLAVGNRYLIVKNWVNDGNIYVFDRKTGKGVRTINRMGQGAGEYSIINGVVLDEENEEMFVNCAPTKKIFVYDLTGRFKRSFEHAGEATYLDVFDYDRDHLIGYDISGYYLEGQPRGDRSYHSIISKQDGSIFRNIPIPFDVIRTPVVQQGDAVAATSVNSIIPYRDNWLLVETSSDTVYEYVPETDRLSPFLVKTSSADPEILLTMGTVTDRYYFMKTVKKVFDFTTGRGFPTADILYDKQENALFDVFVSNGDFVKKKVVDLSLRPVNREIATFRILAAGELVEAYQNDGLKGPLKEIARQLDEESNPVVMLIKYKDRK